MQPSEQTAGLNASKQMHVEAVIETLTSGAEPGESLAEVAHDARNMVAALGLYCDLLETPGVLATPYLHYGDDLRLVASASRRLVQRLATLESSDYAAAFPSGAAYGEAAGPVLMELPPHARQKQTKRWELIPAAPMEDMAAELLASRNLLAALAGPAITLTVETEDAELPVRMTGEDLTRILVNLVKNSTEAMPQGGRIHLSLRESPTFPGEARWVTLTIEDNGPGLPDSALEKAFQPGFTTRSKVSATRGRQVTRRGLGLSITRSIVKAAGGRIHAANRDPSGACFQIELPVRCR